MMSNRSIIKLLSIILGFALALPTTSHGELDDSEIHLEAYKDEGNSLIIMFPSSHGITEGLNELAKNLNKAGNEVWLVDPFTSWFLPASPSSMNKIPVKEYSRLISSAISTGKNIYLYTNDDGTNVLLTAIHEWQKKSDAILSGVILVSPDLYRQTPTAGNEGEFSSIALSSNAPVFIYIPAKSTLTLRTDNILQALQTGGSDVYVQALPDVRNRFYFRPDATKDEIYLAENFHQSIRQAMKLTRSDARKRSPATLAEKSKHGKVRTTSSLRKYTGQLVPDNFQLKDMHGNTRSLRQYKGEVVVVNFWASWCPPCVHEMPSMNSLYNDFKDKKFTILGVNLGEPPEDIKKFLKVYPVDFPVLLDSKQEQPRKWKVFAFPTSYLLDKKGNIRYSVAGEINWNDKQVKSIIEQLILE